MCATKFPAMPKLLDWVSSVGAVREPPFRVISCEKTSLGGVFAAEARHGHPPSAYRHATRPDEL